MTTNTPSKTKDISGYLDRFIELNRFDKFNQMSLEVIEPGHIKYTMPILEDHLSSAGAAHGGVIAGLMDATLGVAALTYSFTMDCLCATVEFKINYFAPVSDKATLEAEGVVDYKGKSLLATTAEIRTKEDGTIVAKGMGTFKVYPISKRRGYMDRPTGDAES